MRYFPPFANSNPIVYPSLIWLSSVGLIALANGYFHMCCYRQYLSNVFPFYRATIVSDTFGKGILCHRYAWFWTQSVYAKSEDLPGCIVCIGDSKIPFWFELLAYQGSMHKEMVQKDCYMQSIRRIRHVFLWSPILGSFIQWIRLKPMNPNALSKKSRPIF